MKKNYLLECCVDSTESAIEAASGGADRLELCSGLVIGGLTPSLALFEEIRSRIQIPIHVLLRPRFGDFCYTSVEISVLLREIELFKHAGAEGVVIGCLTPDGNLNIPDMKRLIAAAKPMHITLHRAFDMCKDPIQTLNEAIDLGIDTILTSGQQNNCKDGKALLEKLHQAANGKIHILVGSGVTPNIIEEFTNTTALCQFHLSGKQEQNSKMIWRNPHVSMGAAGINEYCVWQTSGATIRQCKNLLDKLFK